MPANMGKYPHLVKEFPQGVLHHKGSKGILIYETPDGPRQEEGFFRLVSAPHHQGVIWVARAKPNADAVRKTDYLTPVNMVWNFSDTSFSNRNERF